MEGKNDAEKIDDVILPGFRFHPTDEELVGFYLKMKIQQRPLSIELIKQLDIYKYDPWDLPKFAATGEKECYFYCPRDRKYRNSTRPNRVTGAGFWKATGTDRPIYSSEGTKCIGLKKSLVFYRGRAARGIKTDWMMHEFRLPSAIDSATSKKSIDKSLPANDSWAICRIFKKTNSMAQRALSHSWVSSLPEANMPDMHTHDSHCNQFSSENISCTTEAGSIIQFCFNNDLQQSSSLSFPLLDVPPYKPVNSMDYKPPLLSVSNGEHTTGFTFSPPEMSGPAKCTIDVATMLLNSSPVTLGDTSRATGNIDFSGAQQQCNSFSTTLQQGMQGNMSTGEDETGLRKNPNVNHIDNQWESFHSMGFPFSMPSNLPDEWKSNLPWVSPPCPSEISTSYSTNKCYS